MVSAIIDIMCADHKDSLALFNLILCTAHLASNFFNGHIGISSTETIRK